MSKYELLKFIFALFSLKLSNIIRKLGGEIKEKQYDTKLKEKNVETIIHVAIAFYKKEIKVRYKVG